MGFAWSWTMRLGRGLCPHTEPARQGLTPCAMQDVLPAPSGAASDIVIINSNIWWKGLASRAQI